MATGVLGVGRIDVAYVCSNAAIAQQNVNRLNVLDDDHLSMASRLTLLPLELHRLEDNAVNFVSFTPGTTFNPKSSGGIWRERVVLHRLLARELPELAEPLVHVLRGGVQLGRFRRRIRQQDQPLNEALGRRFLVKLRADPGLLAELHEVCRRFQHHRDPVPDEDRHRQFALIGRCCHLLARECIEALEPDLVILDEFQRFRDLLDGECEAAMLAREVMDYTAPEGHAVRVLLLSATPYKPLTLAGDEENTYEGFLRTLLFLLGDESAVEAGDTVEYWKSAPYALHFMKDYQVKRKLEAAADHPPGELVEALRAHREAVLSAAGVSRYRPLEPANGRLRSLLDEMVEPGQWKLLWVHPTLPYLEPGGAYAEVGEFTKALVFSAWTVVPEAVSALCSYEVERRMLEHGGESVAYADLLRARRPLLRFAESGGRLTGMPTLALLYPSVALQTAVDPLALALRLGGGGPAPAEAVRREAAAAVEALLRSTGLWPRTGEGPPDQRWYWAGWTRRWAPLPPTWWRCWWSWRWRAPPSARPGRSGGSPRSWGLPTPP